MPPNLPRNFGRLQFGGQGLALHFCHKSLNAVPRRLRNPFATPAQLLSAEWAPHDGCATLRNSRATPQRCHDGCATLRNSCATPAQRLSAERAPHDGCATPRSSCATPHGDDGTSKLRVVVRERSLSPQAHTGVYRLSRGRRRRRGLSVSPVEPFWTVRGWLPRDGTAAPRRHTRPSCCGGSFDALWRYARVRPAIAATSTPALASEPTSGSAPAHGTLAHECSDSGVRASQTSGSAAARRRGDTRHDLTNTTR